jgi:hypothetical protein
MGPREIDRSGRTAASLGAAPFGGITSGLQTGTSLLFRHERHVDEWVVVRRLCAVG